MLLGCSIPVVDIGTGPAIVRDYAQAAEGLGYSYLLAPDHVLGANPTPGQGVFAASASVAASFNRDYQRVGTTKNAYHDPFVLFGFLAGCTENIGFTTGVLILAQRQAVLVAKQAASLDELSGGRLRLGIGVRMERSRVHRSAREFPQPWQAIGRTGSGHASIVGVPACQI
jgi:alkanesulfonate monooxygenase SsuD/methylene tetrahydromethanopterin reductase-like flavin-dependent oxidoreductase (luciferase family)